MVGVMGFKLNADLARYLRDQPKDAAPPAPAPALYAYTTPRWRVRDRLSTEAIADLIAAFKAGTPKQALADQYGINLKSVKQLLREHGVKKRSRYDIQP